MVTTRGSGAGQGGHSDERWENRKRGVRPGLFANLLPIRVRPPREPLAKGTDSGKGEESLEKFRQGCLAEYRDPSHEILFDCNRCFHWRCSVIWLLAIGEGIAAEAEGEIMALGANNLILSSKRPSDEGPPKEILLFVRAYENDFTKISNRVPHLSAAYPTREINNRTIFSKHARTRAELLGCLPNFRTCINLKLRRDGFLPMKTI